MNKKLFKQLVVFFCVLWVFCPAGFAATYYVDAAATTGNVDGDGSSGNPWQTITWAVGQVTANDIILTAAGTYTATMPGSVETFPITIPAGVTLRSNATPTTSATIAATGSSVHGIVLSANSTVDGFTITTTSFTNGYYAVQANADAQVLNNSITASKGGVVVSAAGASVINNTIVASAADSPDNGSGIRLNARGYVSGNNATQNGAWINIISIQNAADTSTVEGCTVSGTGTYSNGIYLDDSADSILINNNTVEATGSNTAGIKANGTNASYNITNNKVVGSTTSSPSALYGIVLSINGTVRSGTVASNEVRGFTNGTYLRVLDNFTATLNHNTFVRNTNGININYAGIVNMTNNIVCGGAQPGEYIGGSIGIYRASGTVTSTYNNIWNTETNYNGVSAGTGDISSYPRFKAVSSNNYHLYSDSPCVGTSSGGADIGAYQDDSGTSSIVAASYIDAVSGNDSTGDGSVGSPWKTVAKGIANTTGTINVKAGTYDTSNGETYPFSLSAGQYLKSIADPTTNAILAAGSVGSNNAINLGVGATLEGFSITATTTNANNHAVSLYANSSLINNSIVAANGSAVINGAGALISGNTLTSNGDNNQTMPVKLNARGHVLNNTITHNGGSSFGINFVNAADNSTAEGNTISSTGYAAQGVRAEDSADNITVKSNTIEVDGAGSSYGINMNASNNNYLITNNIVASDGDGSVGIMLSAWNEIGTVGSNEVRNFTTGIHTRIVGSHVATVNHNTLIANDTGINVQNDGTTVTNITNCIVAYDPAGGTSSGKGIDNNGGTANVSYSDVYGNTTGYEGTIGSGVGTISANAQFVNAAGNNYHLGNSSPCIAVGTPEGADMGAYDWIDTAGPTITIEAPNGGETIAGRSTYPITFEATDHSGIAANSLNVYYSVDGGSTYTSVVAGASKTSPYSWIVPNVATTDARVKIELQDAGGYVGTDESAASFTITRGATHYVDASTTEGNVVGDGSSGRPWQTITYAMTQAQAGDQILVEAGTYNSAMSGSSESFPITIPASIYLKSDASPSTNAIIAAGTVSSNYGIIVGNNSTVEGFSITATVDSNYYALQANSASEIRNNSITAGLGSVYGNSAGAVIYGNTIISNSDAARAITLNAAGLISNNSITHNGIASYGVQINNTADNSTVEVCSISASGTSGEGIYIATAGDSITINNCTIEVTGIDGKAIHFFNTYNNYLIKNNKLTGSGASGSYGIFFTGQGYSGTISTNEVNNFVTGFYGLILTPNTLALTNNTFTNNPTGISLGRNGVYTVTNNIVCASPEGGTASGTGIIKGASITLTNSYNNVYGNATNYSGTTAGTGAISSNAKFVNSAGNDYHLSNNSPCIHTATPATSDMGAYQYDMSAGGVPAVRVISPNGSESWEAVSAHNITWQASQDADGITGINLSYSTDDGVSYTAIASAQPNTGSYSWTLPVVNSTNCKISIEATSGANVKGTDESDSKFTIYIPEYTGPTITIETPSASTSWEGGVAHDVVFLATDSYGIKANSMRISYSTNEGTSYVSIATGQATTSAYSWNPVPAFTTNEARIKIEMQDIFNNWGTKESTANFIIDSTNPTAPTAVYPTTGTITNDATPTFSWNAATGLSNIASYEVRIDGTIATTQGAVTSYTPSTTLTDGSHSWDARAKSNVELWGSYSTAQSFTINTTVPAVSLLTLKDRSSGSTSYTNNQLVSIEATGVSGVPTEMMSSESASFTGASWLTYLGTSEFTLSSSDARKTVYYKIRNAGLNESATVTSTITYDATAPTVPTLLSPTNNSNTNDATPLFTWSIATDETSGIGSYEVTLNSTVVTTTTATSYTYPTTLTDGTYTWKVRAQDRALNWGSFSESFTFTLDTQQITTSEITINIPDIDVEIDSDFELNFSRTMETTSVENAFSLQTSSSGASIKSVVSGTFSWNTGNTTMTFTPTNQLSGGTSYTLSVSTAAKDIYGNSLSTAYSKSFTTKSGDPNPPTITMKIKDTAIRSDDYISARPTFSITAIDDVAINASGVTMRVDGTLVTLTTVATSTTAATLEYTPTTDLADESVMTHAITIEATDTNSNKGTKEVTGLKVAKSGDVKVVGEVLTYPTEFKALSGGTCKISYQLSTDADISIYVISKVGMVAWTFKAQSGTDGGKSGYNEVSWNGISDLVRSAVPNGIYMIKIIGNNKVIGSGHVLVLD